MKLQNLKNNSHLHAPVTRQNYFVGLDFVSRIQACIRAIEGETLQFKNETSIVLELAQDGFAEKVVCDTENETGICANLASFDVEAQLCAQHFVKRLKDLTEVKK